MNASLTPELENLVSEKFKSGFYNSAGQVIRESLRLLRVTEHTQRISPQLIAPRN